MILRPATTDDAVAMTTLTNEIILAGETTAHQTPYDAQWMAHA